MAYRALQEEGKLPDDVKRVIFDYTGPRKQWIETAKKDVVSRINNLRLEDATGAIRTLRATTKLRVSHTLRMKFFANRISFTCMLNKEFNVPAQTITSIYIENCCQAYKRLISRQSCLNNEV